MANTFITADQVVGPGLERLRREITLPRYVTRLGLAEFRGRLNDTINIRVPAILEARDYEWRTRNQPIELDEIRELSIPLSIDQHIYSAVALTDEELTLDIVNFVAQVTTPQVIAVAERVEGLVATAMQNANYAAPSVTYTTGSAGFYEALVDAREVLNAAHVPQSDRFVLIGSAIESAALKEEDLRRANTSGGTQTLRRGELGSLAGFDNIITSLSVPSTFAVAYHRSAFAVAMIAPVVPDGVTSGRSVSEGGISMRQIFDYDTMYLRDRSVVSVFAGASSVEDGRDGSGDLTSENVRAVKIEMAGS